MMWYIPDFPNLNHQQYYQDQYETKNNGGFIFNLVIYWSLYTFGVAKALVHSGNPIKKYYCSVQAGLKGNINNWTKPRSFIFQLIYHCCYLECWYNFSCYYNMIFILVVWSFLLLYYCCYNVWYITTINPAEEAAQLIGPYTAGAFSACFVWGPSQRRCFESLKIEWHVKWKQREEWFWGGSLLSYN